MKITTLSDKRLMLIDNILNEKSIDTNTLDKLYKLLQSINSDLLFAKQVLHNKYIYDNDPFLKSLLDKIMDNDCGEESHFQRNKELKNEDEGF